MTEFRPGYLLNAFAYAAMGVLVFVIAVLALERVFTPHARRAIVEEKNVAVAVFLGLMSIGIGLIVAAAFH